MDPLAPEYPELTPYQFASNSPIAGIDLDGLEFKLKIYSHETGQTFLNLAKEGDIYRMRKFTYQLMLAKNAILTKEEYDTYYWFGAANRWESTYKPGVTVELVNNEGAVSDRIFFPRHENGLGFGTPWERDLYPVDANLHNPTNPSAEPGHDYYGSSDIIEAQGTEGAFLGPKTASMQCQMKGFGKVEYYITQEEDAIFSIGFKFEDGSFLGNDLLITPESLEGHGVIYTDQFLGFSAGLWTQYNSSGGISWYGGSVSTELKSTSLEDILFPQLPKPMIEPPSSKTIKRYIELQRDEGRYPIGTNGITHSKPKN